MKIVINIEDYDREWITNCDHIPNEINRKIAEAIIDGIPFPEHYGDLIDRDELLFWSRKIDSMYCIYDEVVDADDIKNAPAIIERNENK